MFRMRSFVSYALVGAGVVLLFLGARDFLASRFGQSEVARDFEETPPPPPVSPSTPDAAPAPPQPGDPVAKLIIPRLAAELYVLEGDGDAELRRGPGHVQRTAMPGDKGNCVIAGHRDTHFRILKDIRKGDDIVLETRDGGYLYRVKKTSIIPPTNLAPLKPTEDPRLNLITCYPFFYVGSAPKRFVVEAQLSGAISANGSPKT